MKKKWIIILSAVLLMAATAVFTIQFLEGDRVEVHRVTRGNLVESFTENGVMVSEDERTVYSLHQAMIEEVAVEEGQHVDEGDLLVVLDTAELSYSLSELQSQMRAINAEISMVKDNLKNAENNHQRIRSLYAQSWATKIELEEAEKIKNETQAGLETLKAKRSSINAQIMTVDHRMNKYRIYAPLSGVVTNLQAEEKGVAGPQQPLMHLFQKDESNEQFLKVETRVLTRDVADLAMGETLELIFEQRDEDLIFPGEITKIASYAEKDISPLGLEEERVTVTIQPDLPEDLTLGPGYKVTVEFVTSVEESVLIVPKRTLFTYQGEDALMVVKDDRAGIRKATTGKETRQEVVISEGLREGDLVIMDPQQEGIDEGSRVIYESP